MTGCREEGESSFLQKADRMVDQLVFMFLFLDSGSSPLQGRTFQLPGLECPSVG